MAMDYKSAITLIKNSYNIVDYIRDEGNDLQANGVQKWKTRCTFHSEKTPSLIINEGFQNYRCFGCGANGDIISYVSERENLSFAQTIKKLAEDKGLEIDLEDNKSNIDYDSLYKILKIAANFYCVEFNKLPDSHLAKKEILERELTWNNKAKDGLYYGYSPNGNKLYELLHAQGFSDELILESGVCRKNEKNGSMYDFFRSRLMFIFTDRYGKPIGFSSRKLFDDDGRGKYVNSSDSPLFNKKRVLYNHSMARKSAGKNKTLYICEGQFDVAAMCAAGLTNSVAASGTAFSKEHGEECLRIVGAGGKLIFCFDGDEAGIKAASRVFMNYPILHENSYVVTFPKKEINGEFKGMDPCDYRIDNGDEALINYVNNSVSMVEFMIKNAKNSYDVNNIVEQAKYIDEGARIIKTVSNNTLRETCMRLLSLESLSPIDDIKTAVKNAKPLEFLQYDDGETSDQNDENFKKKLIESDSNSEEDKQKINNEEILELIDRDYYYTTAAKFITIGLSLREWRNGVIRSKDLIPSKLRFLVDDLEKLKDHDHVFPELFSNVEIANKIMSDDFSPFYRLMTMEELKEHFIYLHSRLEKSINERRTIAMDRKIREMLASDSSNSIDYLEQLLKRKNMMEEQNSTSLTTQ